MRIGSVALHPPAVSFKSAAGSLPRDVAPPAARPVMAWDDGAREDPPSVTDPQLAEFVLKGLLLNSRHEFKQGAVGWDFLHCFCELEGGITWTKTPSGSQTREAKVFVSSPGERVYEVLGGIG